MDLDCSKYLFNVFNKFNMDLWKCVEANASWCDLSIELRNQLNNDSELYGKHILLLSLHNQLLYNGSVSMVSYRICLKG